MQIAKIAAVVAGLGLVAMSFASFAAPAKAATVDDLQAQINALLAQIASLQGGSSSSMSMTFTMDLHNGFHRRRCHGSPELAHLEGVLDPAGATGFFGAQTTSALAAFQAANGISPAAGYFGPITRAKVNSMAGGSTSTGGTTTGGLSGGEADLRSFDLRAGNDLNEGDSNVEIALAKFDVKSGDARVQRVTVEMTRSLPATTSTRGSTSTRSPSTMATRRSVPWTLARRAIGMTSDDDSAHVGSLDFYTIDIPVSDVVKEDETAELSIRADAQGTIDSGDINQTFAVDVPDNGIRAVDSQGIQQYTGQTSDTVTLGFNSEENGDLTVKKASDNPVAGTLVADDQDTSDDFDVLKFQIKNSQSSDAKVTDLTVNVATTTNTTTGHANDITDIIRRATLTVDGDDFDGDVNSNNTIDFKNIDVKVAGDDTTDFTLSVQLYGQSATSQRRARAMTFTVASTNVSAEGWSSGDSLSGGDLSGTAGGEQQSVAVNGGITVAGNSMTAIQTYNSNTPASSYGTFTLKFDVTAVGDDVYIPKTIDTTANTSGHTASTTYAGVILDANMGTTTIGSAVTTSLTTTADSDDAWFYRRA